MTSEFNPELHDNMEVANGDQQLNKTSLENPLDQEPWTHIHQKNSTNTTKLVKALHLASKLEHCLLNAYLYTACTIKTVPEEFEVGVDGHLNRRAAIQFERARQWKKSILLVAHEEMLHLHYVQCLLRALGERPYFELPDKKPGTNTWFIPNWEIKNGCLWITNDQGTIVPIEPCTLESIQHFLLYESTSSLQDIGALDNKAMELYKKLFDFETQFDIESMLFHINETTTHKQLFDKLYNIYTNMSSISEKEKISRAYIKPLETPTKTKDFHFQSIGDLYYQYIRPLYDMAFDNQRVVQDNLDLVTEQLDPHVAAEGFLPIKHNDRYKDFPNSELDEKLKHTNRKKPSQCTPNIPGYCRNKEDVDKIINEIVEEGEGFTDFVNKAEDLLKDVQQYSVDGYLKALLKDRANGNKESTPTWLKNGQLVRESHLYRFAMIMMGLKREKDLTIGGPFEAYRNPVNLGKNNELKQLCTEIPLFFNACYVTMIMWLSRMYETKLWQADKSRRQAMEMIATWPLMSLAIRPFLELASFFPIDRQKLFSFLSTDLPASSAAVTLLQIYISDKRSEEINEKLDCLALETLDAVAAWSNKNYMVVENSTIPEQQKRMILTRLKGLTVLNEFRPQFEFRICGGYSDKSPDQNYEVRHCNSTKYEEDPAKTDEDGQAIKTYQNALLLRLRFSGWGQVQLATDPDPPTDESGCTGTIMLHASDSNCALNRALVWQRHPGDTTEFTRGPADDLPKIGVNCVQLSLMTAGNDVEIGYVPLSEMQSMGAVQANGTQFDLNINGLYEVWRCKPEDVTKQPDKQICIDLLEKNGRKPILLGENHLVWKDGEPIDPFILSIQRDESNGGTVLEFQRQVFDDGKVPMINMTPLERIRSRRGPIGFDSTDNIPAWARSNFLEDKTRQMSPPVYLKDRATKLCAAMQEQLNVSYTDLTAEQAKIAVSFAERMKLVSVPRGTTVGWLMATLHYAHTISGESKVNQNSRILQKVQEQTGISCVIIAEEDRQKVNSRWLVKYTLGVMDTDAISNFIYGEVYIPLSISTLDKQITLNKEWIYDTDLYREIETYACNFGEPFWRKYTDQSNKTRTLLINGMKLVETLAGNLSPAGYEYTQTDFPGIESCSQRVTLFGGSTNKTTFTWNITFKPSNSEGLLKMTDFFGEQNALVGAALGKQFTPISED